jgi:hypothetical protein
MMVGSIVQNLVAKRGMKMTLQQIGQKLGGLHLKIYSEDRYEIGSAWKALIYDGDRCLVYCSGPDIEMAVRRALTVLEEPERFRV